MKKTLVSLFTMIFLLNSCKKDNGNIPAVSVDFYVYLSQPSNFNLNAVGGWIYETAGVRGVIVYRRSNEEFAAYERACTYDPNVSNAKVDVDSSNIIAADKICGSKFVLSDGSVINGPATRSLKTYYADYDAASATVHVHN